MEAESSLLGILIDLAATEGLIADSLMVGEHTRVRGPSASQGTRMKGKLQDGSLYNTLLARIQSILRP